MGTSDRIVEAAQGILVAEGSAAVTMRRVADVVGVTAMAIYKHFANREALLEAVAQRTFGELAATWGARVPEGDWDDRAFGLMGDFLDFALGTPHLYAFLMTERREQARQFPEGFQGGGSPAFSPVVELIAEGMRLGLLRQDDPLEVTLVITSSTQGLVQLYLGGRIALSETEFRALCTRTIRRILHGIQA
ncbi:TetR/AcrR family transcriptional regulator [Nonomuraea sp. NPDC050556]|uniref:TetR/AcrR family transcriptional regulator n=1 Tax=Nonomuraea sp. NPDC050556 TaxID=3364369 RepID=UPI00379AAE3A